MPVTCGFARLVIRVSINLSAASLSRARRDERSHQSAAGRLFPSDQNRKWLGAAPPTVVTASAQSVWSREKTEVISEQTPKPAADKREESSPMTAER